eukprot:12978709-Alexandrium_andersonii.AAC.1
MSASLVGSEMCIRDRELWKLSGGSLEAVWRLSGGRRLFGALRCSPELSSCLLYTSDAADDM